MFPGAFIVGTPGYIVNLDSFPAPHGLGGELFCRLISTQYFVFIFGKVSVLTIVALALERWYAVVKPISYKLRFMRKRIYIYILVIWLLSAITNGSTPLKAQLDKTSQHCTWSNISYPKEIFIPIHNNNIFHSHHHNLDFIFTCLQDTENIASRTRQWKISPHSQKVNADVCFSCWFTDNMLAAEPNLLHSFCIRYHHSTNLIASLHHSSCYV